MPLSEHEQRLLEQIEQQLYAEDPKFARVYRSTDLRSLRRSRLLRATIVLLVGIGMLVAGVVTAYIWVGVAGFVVMLAGLVLALTIFQRYPRARQRAQAGGERPARRGRVGLRARLQERWDRRWDERGRF